MKTHWLFESGPNKILEFAKEIDEESDCSACIHRLVCARDMHRFCGNFRLGTSGETGCQSCSHRYTRFDKDKVPCFTCPHFVKADQSFKAEPT